VSRHRSTVVSTVMCLLVCLAAATGNSLQQQSIPTSGIIAGAGVAVYLDAQATQAATSLEWGLIAPGAQVQKTLYVKNVGTAPMNLNATTNTYIPQGTAAYLTFSCDRQGTQITPQQTIPATFALTVSPTADPVTFSFNINIATAT
jgi:archaellum component FlaG (FlaF/FlaG flagellin family)